LTREKVIATASKKMVVVATRKGCSNARQIPAPVEIIAFARTVIEKKIASLGATPKLRLKPDGSPFITDNGNQFSIAALERLRIQRHWRES